MATLIVVGSRRLAHFDAALVAYTFSILFATFGLTYRYAFWLQRPPMGRYWRRGREAFLGQLRRPGVLAAWLRRSVADVFANRFILRRDRLRGLTHLLLSCGGASWRWRSPSPWSSAGSTSSRSPATWPSTRPWSSGSRRSASPTTRPRGSSSSTASYGHRFW